MCRHVALANGQSSTGSSCSFVNTAMGQRAEKLSTGPVIPVPTSATSFPSFVCQECLSWSAGKGRVFMDEATLYRLSLIVTMKNGLKQITSFGTQYRKKRYLKQNINAGSMKNILKETASNVKHHLLRKLDFFGYVRNATTISLKLRACLVIPILLALASSIHP